MPQSINNYQYLDFINLTPKDRLRNQTMITHTDLLINPDEEKLCLFKGMNEVQAINLKITNPSDFVISLNMKSKLIRFDMITGASLLEKKPTYSKCFIHEYKFLDKKIFMDTVNLLNEVGFKFNFYNY